MKLDTRRADAQKLAAPGTAATPGSFAAAYQKTCHDLLQKEGPVIWRNLDPVADPAAAAAAVQDCWEALCQQVCDRMTDWLYDHNGLVGQWPHPASGAVLTARTRRGKPVQGVPFHYFAAPLAYDPQLACLVPEDPWLQARDMRYGAMAMPQRPLAHAWHVDRANKARQPYLEVFRQRYKQETDDLYKRWQQAENAWETAVRENEDAASCQAAEQQALQLRKAYIDASDMRLWRQRFEAHLDTDEYRTLAKDWQAAKDWTAGHAARVEEYLATMRLRDEKIALGAAWQRAWFDYLRGQGLAARAVLTLEEGEMPQ